MAMDKEALRKRRGAAVQIELHVEDGDAIREMIPREGGLFFLTRNRVMRVRSPETIDPELEHENAPWEQSVYLPHGSSDPLVARTILQTIRMGEIFLGKQSVKFAALLDISWEVMNSVVSLRLIRQRLEKRIVEAASIIDEDRPKYTVGKSPLPLPIVEYYDIEFRSFVNEVRRVLSKISELFGVFTPVSFDGGHFHKAAEWAVREKGRDHLLSQILVENQAWIRTWIDIRIAIEHPRSDAFVETLNFALQPDRNIRLPTWKFVHPDYKTARPQNLLDVFEMCVENVLGFFEILQIALLDGNLPGWIKVGIEQVAEADRDANEPMRYRFHVFPQHLPPKATAPATQA